MNVVPFGPEVPGTGPIQALTVFDGTVTANRQEPVTSSLAKFVFGSSNFISDNPKMFTSTHSFAALPASYPTITNSDAFVPTAALKV